MVTVFHKGRMGKDLRSVLSFNSESNKILLVTDHPQDFEEKTNLEILDLKKVSADKETEFYYQNYKPKFAINDRYQRDTFERAFAVCYLIKKYGEIYHMDSDTLLFEKIENLNLKSNAYFAPLDYGNKWRMSDSIHFSYLNEKFADEFKNIFTDFFVDGNQDWAEEKMEFHKTSGVIGELIDMNFYTLMSKNYEVQNLMNPSFDYTNKNYLGMFDFNISMSEGESSESFYKMLNGFKHIRYYGPGNFSCFNQDSNEEIKMITAHLQGGAKQLANYFIS